MIAERLRERKEMALLKQPLRQLLLP